MNATKMFSRRALLLLAAMVAVFASTLAFGPAANAATQAGYPSALIEFQASTRTEPRVNSSTYWGFALRQYGSTARQTASVMCWYDGDTATGNYTTNRWFKVLVWESYDGYNTPRWLFVHASYVYNQPGVRMCNRTSTGYW